MAKGFHPVNHSSHMPSTSSEANNTTIRDQHMNSGNRGGLSLPLVNQMAIPIYTSHSRKEVEEGGQYLFQDFIHHEFEVENLSDEVLVVHDPFPPGPSGDVSPRIRFRAASPTIATQTVLTDTPGSSVFYSTPVGYNNENWIRMGHNIRELADQFARSKERPLIKQQADQVDLSHINRNSFFQMLNAIFQDGINKQCIVALFFFCSDVLIRCVKQELMQQGNKLFLWSLQFLVERVCKWVYDHGGWERVFANIYNVVFKISAILALGVIVTCGLIWMRKNL